MDKRIVFKNEAGGVSIIVPIDDGIFTIEQIARKDVPTGKPFAIIDIADVSADRSERADWTVNDEDLTDGVGE